jgi:hypothetical protein
LYTTFQLVPDKEWVLAEKKRLGLPNTPITFKVHSRSGDLLFRHEDGSVFTNAGDILETLVPSYGERVLVQYRFDEPVFVDINHQTFKRIKILGLDADIEDASCLEQTLQIDVNAIVAFILKNVADGTFRRLDAQGHPFGNRK